MAEGMVSEILTEQQNLSSAEQAEPQRTHRQMKAVVKYAPGEGNVDVLDIEEPFCGDNQVKLEIAYCGVCGTDIHVLHDTFRNYPPVILGHEFSGTVVEVA